MSDNMPKRDQSKNVDKRVLCLTPECQKLWAIRPGMCFLYDEIIIDSSDYDDIMATQEDSSYNFLLARNVERLRMEGILLRQPYSPLLPEAVRRAIHAQADRYIEALPMEKRVGLAALGHAEYAEYLKGQILFCREDEPKFRTLTERLGRVVRRTDSVAETRTTTNEIDEAMKRTVAKSLAGAYIVSEIGHGHLYDTSEYRPFVTGIAIDRDLKQLAEVKQHDRAEDRAFDMVAAIILKKSLPDITVFDDHTVTMFMRTREELARLRSLIAGVVAQYHDLIEANTDTAYEHLHQRFQNALQKLERELKAISKRTGLLWKVTEILASIKMPILGPVLQPLFKKNMKTHRKSQIAELAVEDRLMADFVFVFDEVRFGEKRYEIGPNRTFRGSGKGPTAIWGQEEHELPWYERA